MKNPILINCAIFCFMIGCMIHKEDYSNKYRLAVLALLGVSILGEYLIKVYSNSEPTKRMKCPCRKLNN